ncbi:MAG: hypothetical protein RIR00_2422 [Pseudomonadota bacterium]|jgi:hypothetical protein
MNVPFLRKLKDAEMPKMSIKEKMLASIRRSKVNAFLRKDFDRFGGYRQVSRLISELVSEGVLLRVGYGTYVKTRPSSLSGKPVPADTLLNVTFEIMKKLGVKADVGRDTKALREGRSTQVPMLPVVNVGKSRVSRKISYGNKTVTYEKSR